MVGNYKVITLCGSIRFKSAFMNVQKLLTLEGNIVISVGMFGHSGDNEVWEEMDKDTRANTKIMLDDMHKRKIDMADEIFVINEDGYIGESTKSEIEYAKAHGKAVCYLENENPGDNIHLDTKKISVSRLPISTRLYHILTRNGVKHLHKEEKHCEEMFLNFRNMEKKTLDELKEVCKNYGIRIYSRLDLEVPDEELYLSAD